MPTYTYKAKEGPGKTVEGEIAAESRQAALGFIEARGMSPVWVEEKAVGGGAVGRVVGLGRIGRRDVTVFTRQLAALIKSGVPILKALGTVSEQTDNPHLARVAENIGRGIRDGGMLSDSLAKYPRLFPLLYVNMVRSGESGGVLDTILERLADAREREEDMRRKVASAVAYPLLIVIMGLATVFVLLTFFMPKVMDIFDQYKGRQLPLPTRILIGTSDFFSAHWYWILIITLLVLAVAHRLAALETGKTFFHGILLRLPVLNRFLQYSDIARFARTLALLLNAGIQIDRALLLCADMLRNAVLKAEIERVRHETVVQGAPLSGGLKKARHFPPLVANMIAVGEQSGRLDEALNEIALFYEKEVDYSGRLVTALLEPTLILVVGAIVGFIVSAMLMPIFELSSAIR